MRTNPKRSRVYVDVFTGWHDRPPHISLKFRPDARLDSLIDYALRQLPSDDDGPTLGGYVPEEGCWVIDLDAWPIVRSVFRLYGVKLTGPGVGAFDDTDDRGNLATTSGRITR